MLRFTASKLLIRNLNLLKGAFLYSTGFTGSVYFNPTNWLEDLGKKTGEVEVSRKLNSIGLTWKSIKKYAFSAYYNYNSNVNPLKINFTKSYNLLVIPQIPQDK